MKRTKITRVAVDRLRLNEGQLPWLPKNPRSWTQTDIDRMVKSIDEDPDFAEVRPVLATPGEGKELIVFAHNLLTKAAMVRGDKTLPVAVYEPETEEDHETIRRLALKDNGSFGSWDTDILANEWDAEPWQLEDWGVPEWITGGAGKETGNGAGTSGAEGSAKSAKEDEGFGPDKGILVRCKPGDIWELGEHRLMCGDSTDDRNFVKLLDGEEARLCVTSPPYGVGKSYEEFGIEPWRKTIFGAIEAITKHARIIAWNIADLYCTGTQFIEPTSMYSAEKMRECGFLPMYVRIWKKQGGNFAGTEPYYTVSMKPVQEYEWILCFAKAAYEKDYEPIIKYMAEQAAIAQLNNAILKEITGAGFMYGHWFTSHQWSMLDRTNYLKIAKYCAQNGINAFQRDYDELRRWYDNLNIFGKLLPKEEESAWGQWAIWEMATVNKRTGGHPAEFPVELPARLIKMHSREGDIILDPFGGSGTTIVAAEQLGRKARLMEIDPHYCDVILSRWEQLTGRKATRLN